MFKSSKFNCDTCRVGTMATNDQLILVAVGVLRWGRAREGDDHGEDDGPLHLPRGDSLDLRRLVAVAVVVGQPLILETLETLGTTSFAVRNSGGTSWRDVLEPILLTTEMAALDRWGCGLLPRLLIQCTFLMGGSILQYIHTLHRGMSESNTLKF